jgi:hypothetical protein
LKVFFSIFVSFLGDQEYGAVALELTGSSKGRLSVAGKRTGSCGKYRSLRHATRIAAAVGLSLKQ